MGWVKYSWEAPMAVGAESRGDKNACDAAALYNRIVDRMNSLGRHAGTRDG